MYNRCYYCNAPMKEARKEKQTMDYQQKKSIVNIVQAAALLAVYGIYVFNKLNGGVVGWEDTHFFAVTMLKFIGIGVVITIIIQILFHIALSVSIAVKERNKESGEIESAINAAMVEDERDKLIDLKSTRISAIAFMMGFIAGLVLLALGHPVAMMLNLVFFAGGLGTIAEEVTKLVYYRAGGRNA